MHLGATGFLENENNQSISDALNQMSSRIEEIDTPQLISSLEIIDSNLSDIYQRIDSMEDNSTVSGLSPGALATKIIKVFPWLACLESMELSTFFAMTELFFINSGIALPDPNLTGAEWKVISLHFRVERWKQGKSQFRLYLQT